MSDQIKENSGYGKEYSEDNFWNKVKNVCKKAGIKVVYSALMLYYAFQEKETPIWAKGIIVGALGYFISPVDAIPDIVPVVGYADDLGVLIAAIASVGAYINDEVKQHAKDKLRDWFGSFNEEELL
jgi:uncharacterized membrane protein YkvA (DUF1232 family)